MHVSASNIGWRPDEETEIAAMLQESGVERVDVAPGRYFPDPEVATDLQIAAVRRDWAARGIRIYGMQALLFGSQGLNLFEDRDAAMLRRLAAVCRIAGKLGVHALSFGSPRQRDRTGLTDEEAHDIAVAFFRKLGDASGDAGVLFCLEPTPLKYGANFMVRTDEAAAIVRAVDHPAIRLHLDIGALALNGEPAAATIARHAALIGHVHASEPDMGTLGDGSAPHEEAAAALQALRPDLTVTIEMIASQNTSNASRILRAVRFALRCYGNAR